MLELNERSLFDGPPPGKSVEGAWPKTTTRDRKKMRDHRQKWERAFEKRAGWTEDQFAEEAEVLALDIATFPVRRFSAYGHLLTEESNNDE